MEDTAETTEETEAAEQEDEGTEENLEEEMLAEETETIEEAEEPEEVKEEITEEAAKEEAVAEAEEEREVEKEEEKKEIEEEIVEEKFYTIPLRRAWVPPRNKRAPKAMRIVKSFVRKHMKLRTEVEEEGEEAEKLVISNEVNEKIWSRGNQKPPRRIRVRAVRDKEGTITVYLAEGD